MTLVHNNQTFLHEIKKIPSKNNTQINEYFLSHVLKQIIPKNQDSDSMANDIFNDWLLNLYAEKLNSNVKIIDNIIPD